MWCLGYNWLDMVMNPGEHNNSAQPAHQGFSMEALMAHTFTEHATERFTEHPLIAGIRQVIDERNSLLAQQEALSQRAQKWEDLATKDELTGLPNRRAFLNTLQSYAERKPGNYAVVFVDLNGLKAINDDLGHDAGNEFIDRAGGIMDKYTRHQESEEYPGSREHDVVSKLTARLSGDEFGIVLPGVSTQEQVDAFTARMTKKLSEGGISASMGGRVHRPGETGLELLAAADLLMYEKKMAGKEAAIQALPFRQRMAYKLGQKLIKFSGIRTR